MSTTATLCFDNGLQLNPAIVHVDYELEAMNILKEIFWNVFRRLIQQVGFETNTVVDKQILISWSLLKDFSADATVAGIVNNILKLTQTFRNISQSL